MARRRPPKFAPGDYNLYLVTGPHPQTGTPTLRVWASPAQPEDNPEVLPQSPAGDKAFAFLGQAHCDTEAELDTVCQSFQRMWIQSVAPSAQVEASATAADTRPARTAKQYVTDGLTACLPPGTPLMGEIIRAKFTGKEQAEGELILFDGGRGTVELSKWSKQYEDAWAQRWLSLEGGAINWTGTDWERVPDEYRQLDLFAGLAELANPTEGKEVSP